MKIALVGGSASNKEAPFHDDSWQIWVLGNQIDQYINKRVNRIFEIHENIDHFDKKYPKYLVDLNIPLVVSRNFPISCAYAIEFDYEKASNLIGENFSSSVAVMMAQAIMDGATEIGIWGVDMALDDHEYFYQRPSMEQWIGYAKGLGLKLTIHESSPLGYTTFREGVHWPTDEAKQYITESEYDDMIGIHSKACEDLEKEIKSLLAVEERLTSLKAQYQAHDGARQVYVRLKKIERAKKAGIDVDIRAING